MDLNDLKRGLRVGVPIGAAIGISSFGYSHSIRHAVAIALATTFLSAGIQGLMEGVAARRRFSHGITLERPPVRPKLLLKLSTPPREAVGLCREALRSAAIRVKRVESDDPCQITAVTKYSFWSSSSRITIGARDRPQGGCCLEISSQPRLPTVVADFGSNYENVFLISKFAKDRLGGEVIEETCIDLDNKANPDCLWPNHPES